MIDPERLREALEWWDSFGPGFDDAFPDPKHIPTMVDTARQFLRILEADDQVVEELGELLWRMSTSGDPGEDCRPQARAVLARLGGTE